MVRLFSMTAYRFTCTNTKPDHMGRTTQRWARLNVQPECLHGWKKTPLLVVCFVFSGITSISFPLSKVQNAFRMQISCSFFL